MKSYMRLTAALALMVAIALPALAASPDNVYRQDAIERLGQIDSSVPHLAASPQSPKSTFSITAAAAAAAGESFEIISNSHPGLRNAVGITTGVSGHNYVSSYSGRSAYQQPEMSPALSSTAATALRRHQKPRLSRYSGNHSLMSAYSHGLRQPQRDRRRFHLYA